MTKYAVRPTKQFKKDLKLAKKSGKNIDLLKEVITALADGKKLAAKFRDHQLGGNWQNYRECHVEPDWLLIYKQERNVLVLTLVRTGSHSELFCK